MSGEAFETFLSCDMRTASDGVSTEYARGQAGYPRWLDERRNGWAECYLYAHNAIELAARAVEGQVMDGISGDHPEKRAQTAAILRAGAELARELAYDHACDGAVTDEGWTDALARVVEATGLRSSPTTTKAE